MTEEIYYDENRNIIDKPLDQKDEDSESEPQTLDCNGNTLKDGDTIIAIKGLPVKGGTDIKKGEKFRNISLTDDTGMVTSKHKQNGKMYLKTEFFKRG